MHFLLSCFGSYQRKIVKKSSHSSLTIIKSQFTLAPRQLQMGLITPSDASCLIGRKTASQQRTAAVYADSDEKLPEDIQSIACCVQSSV